MLIDSLCRSRASLGLRDSIDPGAQLVVTRQLVWPSKRGVLGDQIVEHGRNVTFQLAEVAIPRRSFAGDPATDRRPASTARADMTPRVIAAAGLNRRVPGYRHLPNERLQVPDCTLAGSPTHRASYPKSPFRL